MLMRKQQLECLTDQEKGGKEKERGRRQIYSDGLSRTVEGGSKIPRRRRRKRIRKMKEGREERKQEERLGVEEKRRRGGRGKEKGMVMMMVM